MFPRVVSVKPLHDHWLELTFSDGISAPVDFSKWIVGHHGVFEPLQDLDFFRQVSVDREAGTVVWPNGVDFCPDVLYAEAMGVRLPVVAQDEQ